MDNMHNSLLPIPPEFCAAIAFVEMAGKSQLHPPLSFFLSLSFFLFLLFLSLFSISLSLSLSLSLSSASFNKLSNSASEREGER
jgi:hypothetical protein